MSPFRAPPRIELGSLDVGLERAARRAMISAIPTGGRLIVPDDHAPAMRTRHHRAPAIGALGSLGLVVVGACAFVAVTCGWEPHAADGAPITVALIVAGGLSLAAVLRALDAPRERRTLPGDVVRRAARRALRRAQCLSRQAVRSPERFDPRRVASLRKTLAMLADPMVTGWIPADVRGRAELLLARAVAACAGDRWTRDPDVRTEIRALLLAAAEHLVEPSPATSDLVALARREGAANLSACASERSSGTANRLRARRAPSRRRPSCRFADDEALDAELDAKEQAGAERDHGRLHR